MDNYAQTADTDKLFDSLRTQLRDAGYSEAFIDSAMTVTSIMYQFPDEGEKFDQKWFMTLPADKQQTLINYGLEYKMPEEFKSQTKSYQGEYSNDKWVAIGAANEGFKYFGDATYSYVDNPDKKATQTRIYQGWFSFYGAKNSRIQDLRGEFNMDKQVGKWQCIFHYDGEYYWVKVTFNDNGEIEGDFAIYVGKKLPESNVSPDGMRLMFSGTVKNHYVTKLNYEGTRFNRTVKIVNGRYGSGNGHPAYQWNIQLTDDTNPRSTMYNNLSHLKKGVYSIQYVKTDSKASQWGEDDNWATWKDYGKCFYVEQSTGERKDAGRDIAEIPLRLSNEVAGLLNVVVMRDSSGVKRYYNPY